MVCELSNIARNFDRFCELNSQSVVHIKFNNQHVINVFNWVSLNFTFVLNRKKGSPSDYFCANYWKKNHKYS